MGGHKLGPAALGTLVGGGCPRAAGLYGRPSGRHDSNSGRRYRRRRYGLGDAGIIRTRRPGPCSAACPRLGAPYPVSALRRRILKISPTCSILTSECPVSRQNASKSAGAAVSVANTSSNLPASTSFSIFRARNTGNGQRNPVASRIVRSSDIRAQCVGMRI